MARLSDTPENRSDREPQPGDGPEYHADHAAWEERQRRRWFCILCGESKRHYPGHVFCDDCEREGQRLADRIKAEG